MTLISTPACNKCIAVVWWRIVCGETCCCTRRGRRSEAIRTASISRFVTFERVIVFPSLLGSKVEVASNWRLKRNQARTAFIVECHSGTAPLLSALAVEMDAWGTVIEYHVANLDPDDLRHAHPCVVHQQKQQRKAMINSGVISANAIVSGDLPKRTSAKLRNRTKPSR